MYQLHYTCYEIYVDMREHCCKATRGEPGWRNLAMAFVDGEYTRQGEAEL
jgi:hypothetical protein